MMPVPEAVDTEHGAQILRPDGTVRSGAEPPDLSDETLLEIYRWMVLGRHFDERTINLQRQGRIGTYTPMAGQEGALVGSALALGDDDWVVPSFREHIAKVIRGVPLTDVLLYWMGHEEANQTPEDAQVLPEAIPVGSQIPHATGVAWAAKLRGGDHAVLCYFGDGATSEGDFHEGLNFAGVFDVPVVFFCNNNQWAISIPWQEQTASENIAMKADAYGFEGVRVDGMDPLAVYATTQYARRKAMTVDSETRRPTLIEAVQYRFGPHTTADDPSIYRSDEELAYWRERDPISRFETFLRNRGLLDDETVETIEASTRETVADAINAAESVEADPDDMFDHVYAEPTPRIEAQKRELTDLLDEYGDDAFIEDH